MSTMGQSNAPDVEPIPFRRLVAIALLTFLLGFIVLEIVDPRWLRVPPSETPLPGLPASPASPRPSPSPSPRTPSVVPAARSWDWTSLPEETNPRGLRASSQVQAGPP